MEDFDYDGLREELVNYYGTAQYYNPLAQADLVYVSSCSRDELIIFAINNHFNVSKYVKGDTYGNNK